MVVCKFFQQGNCRYGQNCRFEHIYGSKYSYNAGGSAPPAAAPATVTDEQLVNQVHSDVQAALRGQQWILSSYAPFKEKPTFPGIIDLSRDEARLFIYEAKANNTLDQAMAYVNNLFHEARQKYEYLLQKNPNITKLLRSLYKGENVPSPFGSTVQGNTEASSVFRSAMQTNSVFAPSNATQSIFNQSTLPTNTSTDPAKSLFAQATQNVFSTNQNVFSPSESVMNQNMSTNQAAQSVAKSIFAQATQNVFNQPPNPSNIFATALQPTWGQNEQSSPFTQTSVQNNVFQKNENVFEQKQFSQDAVVEGNVYSKPEELSPEDIEAFQSEDFKMGFIPELPPPRSLCF